MHLKGDIEKNPGPKKDFFSNVLYWPLESK